MRCFAMPGKDTNFEGEKPSHSLVEQRRTEHGAPLVSGIVPTIVKSEREILFEILSDNLPYMTDKDKVNAVENLLKLPPGHKRNAFLKVFIIKHREYAILNLPPAA